ncbi:Poly [ADP-ribose] polymerase tankyrase-2 [Phytophthora ramorum]|nr:Poly [ADP-ribose] polymerase tankyrase-2 [Phytophthora ramorum]
MEDAYYTPGNEEGVQGGTYPEGYSDYYQQEEGEGDYYAGYEQQGFEEYYQQEAGHESDVYQYNYEGCDAYPTTGGQDYNSGEGYTVEQQEHAIETSETWSYSPEEGQQFYLDQLTMEQAAGYYYDEQGNLVTGPESPTNVFTQEGYWGSGQNSNTTPEENPQDETEGLTESPTLDSDTTEAPENVATPESSRSPRKKDKHASPPKKKKSKKERVQKRQALLEKEEEERIKALEDAEVASASNHAADGTAMSTKTGKLSKKKTGFLDREKAKFQLKLRIAKAIKRKRMPVQIRILPKTRKYLSPMEKYFGSVSVECVLSDIFWSSMKGDLGRVKHLVEIEGESPTDSKLDPWNLHQTPLHWAAKGGSIPVVDYLLAAGASPRSLDENGSLPLHLSCWAGHVDASIVLLRASDVKDLYVQDYDGAMCPLDWVNVRSHTKLLKAIEKYQDSLWLPKFVDDLIRGIVRYKIKIFKDAPQKPVKAPAKDDAKTDAGTEPATPGTENPGDKPGESPANDTTASKTSLLTRAKTEKVERKLATKDKKSSSKSLG